MKSNFQWAVILDFEATCDDQKGFGPHEIIEFPSVLMALDNHQVIDEFQSFVRPVHNPLLTGFCTALTSITQDDVDKAPVFPEVLDRHGEWLAGRGLNAENSCFVTCGDWDLGTMFSAQCRVAQPPVIDFPSIYWRWLNIKALFKEMKELTRPGGMARMLRVLELHLEGCHHRGLDDCRNIAAILRVLLREGGVFEPTGKNQTAP